MQDKTIEPRRVLVLGATGGIGRQVLAQSVQCGHQVTALVRSPDKLSVFAQHVAVVQGDPLDASSLARSASDQDAVISALGPPGAGPTTVHAAGARSLVSALAGSRCRRVVLVSAAVLFEDAGALAALLRATLLRHIAADTGTAERIVAASTLDWTFVRPPRLTNGPLTGRWQATPDRLPRGWSSTISRADVAACLLRELQHTEHVRRVVGVATTH